MSKMETSEGSKHLKSNLHTAFLLETLLDFGSKGHFTDVRLICGDGSEFSAHRAVLAAGSQMFRDLFLRSSEFGTTYRGGPSVVYLNNLAGKIMPFIIRYLYTSEVTLPLEYLEEFGEASTFLKLNSFYEDGDGPTVDPAAFNGAAGQVDGGLCSKCHMYPSVPKVKRDPDAESNEENGDGYFFDDGEDEKPVRKQKGQPTLFDFLKEKVDPATGQKSFQCQICKHSCDQKGNLKRHMQIKHGKPKNLPCDFCDKTFTNKFALSKHLKTVCIKNLKFDG